MQCFKYNVILKQTAFNLLNYKYYSADSKAVQSPIKKLVTRVIYFLQSQLFDSYFFTIIMFRPYLLVKIIFGFSQILSFNLINFKTC